ncbi:Mrr restriction system protein [Thermincola ferriacetica]|uniref:Mrr restriction system protein n=1 Tax=Thermincola ferriacetica TaxID=281456 RepID=A0A0L6VYH6_9FIRM|nr:restriction endonuclease [Thermincola ferriacetica]KNZ68208.1 Mrr restriction system protein [Thermincola ferriacetica]
MPVPKFDELFNPLLKALKLLGGSASISEMEEKVAEILQLCDEDINEIHSGSRTKLNYNLAWARTYLKRYGLLENSTRGVWALTNEGLNTASVDPSDVVKVGRGQAPQGTVEGERGQPVVLEEEIEQTWKEKLLQTIKEMSPDAFERLCMRLLRELGFDNVEVTGRSGDMGIDGKGVLKLGGVLSFNIAFQAKRYKDSVSPGVIRDFRGAIEGRADKGLIISTGIFTKAAKEEASRDGAKTIDLIDGEELAEKLKNLRIGVKVTEKIVEEISIDTDWFKKL